MLTENNRIWKFVSHLFLSIDQLGNALAGGNSDNTISARIGFYNHHSSPKNEVSGYWKFLEWVIDTTFEPVDGKGHCHEAYHNDAGEIFDSEITRFFIVIASVIIIVSCVVIALVLYPLAGLGILKQKKIDRSVNLATRFDYCNLQLKSILQELDEHSIKDLDLTNAKVSFERLKGRVDYIESVLESGTMQSSI